MKLPLTAIPISTRDGTLHQDSKAINLLGGKKRAGLTSVQTLPTGAGQGMFNSSTLGALAIVNNNIYSITTGALIAAIPSGVGPYDITQALPNGLIAFKDSFHIWTLTGSTVALVTRSSSQNMLPGFEYLDGTYYVLAVNGELQGSDLNNPASWPALNFVMLNADLGAAVALGQQLNYIVGFSDQFAMFYYDAGNPPPGSPLSPVQSSYTDIGCASAGSICAVGNALVFMGKASTKGRAIYLMAGVQAQNVSNEFIDRILEKSNLSSVSSFTVKIDGMELYVLTLRDLGLSLVFNISGKSWEVWTSSTTVAPDPVVANSYSQGAFSSNVYLNGSGMDLLQHDTNGKVYQMLATTYQDDGLPIDVQIVTPQMESDTAEFVLIGAAEVLGDKVSSTGYLRYSDDDYMTWSPYQLLALAAPRSQAVRQGSFRERAYQFRHTDNVPLRLRTLKLDVFK